MPFSWSNLKKPIYILAPMEDVTDCAFREMFARYSVQAPRTNSQEPNGNNFVMFTEFVSVDGLDHPEGRKKLSIDLQFTENQRPIIGQIWGSDPEKFYRAAVYLRELGFDGIDINMGCPQSKEIAVGACAALIRTPKLAQEIIAATKRGAGSLPVSVKTRIGYSKTDEMEAWVKNLLEMDIAGLTLHGRTKKEMSKVPAHWDRIADAVKIRDEVQADRKPEGRTPIIGNGDVKSMAEAKQRIQETGVDGIMIGRGAFGSPWLFKDDGFEPGMEERFKIMLEHAELFEKMYSGIKSFAIMRKHFKAYCSGFPGAAEIRAELMETKSFGEVKAIVEKHVKTA